MTTVFKRVFQLWAYTVSHGQLLLRSTKAEGLPTRIDLLFKDVVALKLPSTFNELSVSEATAEDVGLSLTVVGGRSVWRVAGPGFDGFVAAGAMVAHEDDGEYGDPSAVYPG
jgi:hypothetical protein